MSRFSFLRKRFKDPDAPLCGRDGNKILDFLSKALVFNDSPTVKWDVSENSGFRANAIAKKPIPTAQEEEECKILKLTQDRPLFIEEGEDIDENTIWVTFGTVEHQPATNYNETFQLTAGEINYIYAHVQLGQQVNLTVLEWQIEVDTNTRERVDSWEFDSTRPTEANIQLGYAVPLPSGGWEIISPCGDIFIDEYRINTSTNGSEFTRNIVYRRVK